MSQRIALVGDLQFTEELYGKTPFAILDFVAELKETADIYRLCEGEAI